MPNAETLFVFVAAAFVLLVIPGPGVFYVVARSMSQGHRAGLVSALGLSAGALVHVAAATAGLSAILFASATLFSVVKFVGAGYLVYLGLRILFSDRSVVNSDTLSADSLSRVFIDGVVVSVFNPKIAIFFLAFFPQFVDPTSVDASQHLLVLGLIYAVLALMTDGCYALLAVRIRRRVGRHILDGSLPRLLSGLLFVGLGVSAAFGGRRN